MNYEHLNSILAAIEAGKEVEARQNNKSTWRKPRPGEHLEDSIGTLNSPNLWRIKPVPRKVPFGPEDIKSDMWIMLKGTEIWCKISSFDELGVELSSGAELAYHKLSIAATYRLDSWPMDKTEKCEKEVSE